MVLRKTLEIKYIKKNIKIEKLNFWASIMISGWFVLIFSIFFWKQYQTHFFYLELD